MANEHHTVADFLADPFFEQWITHPTPKSTTHWQQWQKEHPDRLAALEEARRIILHRHLNKVNPIIEDAEVSPPSRVSTNKLPQKTFLRWLLFIGVGTAILILFVILLLQ